MKVNLYLSAEGAENLANGASLYPWNIVPRFPDELCYNEAPANHTLVGSAAIEMPARQDAVKVAEALLHDKIREIRAEAHKAEMEIKERLDKLLALTWEQPK